MVDSAARGPVRIGNCSGFLGDRMSAARELVDSGEIDVLTGDWLAELTMLILARQRMKHGAGSGYARTFVTQMEQVLGTCLDRGIRVVSNAGGLDPQGCADALAELATSLGLSPRIGVVTGDDVLPVISARPEDFPHLDTGESLGGRAPLTANAYLGGEPVSAALGAGADVVITGRITDAALVIGPAAWWHGWSYADAAAGDPEALDRLAGAVVAGHVIECGAQATGGNYSFFTEVPSWPAGFPIAEVAADGSSVITKATGSGGLVSVGTVTSQLVYEIAGPAYANPDVTALFDTINLAPAGPDRVLIDGVRGAPAPEKLKVAVNLFAGFRNTMSLVLTGRDAGAKADLALRMVAGVGLHEALGDPAAGRPAPSPRDLARACNLDVSALHVAFEDVAAQDPTTTAAAQGHLRITVKDMEQRKVGKPFTTAVVESALGAYPGMFPTAPPAEGTAYGIYWPTLIDRSEVQVEVTVDGAPVAPASAGRPVGEATSPSSPGGAVAPARRIEEPSAGSPPAAPATAAWSAGESPGGDVDAVVASPDWGYVYGTVLGDVVGARSGDKGGNANVGVWIPEPGVGPSASLTPEDVAARYSWLEGWLTPNKVRELLPEAADLAVDVYPLPNLRAVNIVIRGLLGSGVADSTSLDPQAKGLAEHLRARRLR
ncbi:MAG TPA: acyclic terpene utilization AtuA family protein [Motilibacterales bacterium]|nr:acyclic terpene utilization AtuA family protein [Motilibacterales bacterium]